MTTDTGRFSVNHQAETHQVFNQSRPLVDYNAYDSDAALKQAVKRHGAAWAEASLSAHGAVTGSAGVIEWGFLANEYKPGFEPHDRQGYRVDRVRYHRSEERRVGKECRSRWSRYH